MPLFGKKKDKTGKHKKDESSERMSSASNTRTLPPLPTSSNKPGGDDEAVYEEINHYEDLQQMPDRATDPQYESLQHRSPYANVPGWDGARPPSDTPFYDYEEPVSSSSRGPTVDMYDYAYQTGEAVANSREVDCYITPSESARASGYVNTRIPGESENRTGDRGIMAAKGDDPKFLVVAIDFGTTYSGYAFSFHHDYIQDKLKIHANSWIGGGQGIISHKTPSTVLLTPDGKFHSFGYEAEAKYYELAETEEHTGWHYFRRFKMMLHKNASVHRTDSLVDDQKHEMPAKTVFSMAIRYLKDHALENLRNKVADIEESDIHWVLTVPAIWNDSAKQFMRECAIEAGIKDSKLILALEPEAASVYCKELPLEKLDVGTTKGGSSFKSFKTGTKYMVLDLGGGTVDVTVHQVDAHGSLHEVYRASGGAWGGMSVDAAYEEFLAKVFNNDVIREFSREHKGDYLDLTREFELKKRSITPDSEGKIVIRIPATLLKKYEKAVNKKLSEILPNTPFKDTVELKRDKLHVKADVVKEFFGQAIASIVNHTLEITLAHPETDLTTILLVGGFAESAMVRDNLRAMFPDRRIIVPEEAGLAVLKGAVLFGFDPQVITSRISKYTYGVEICVPFITGYHPENYRLWDGKGYLCRYVFDKYIEIGQPIRANEVYSKTYQPSHEDAVKGIVIFAATSVSPTFVSDPTCNKVGSITLEEPSGGWNERSKITLEMKFGETEFTVQITDNTSRKTYSNSFDFLK